MVDLDDLLAVKHASQANRRARLAPARRLRYMAGMAGPRPEQARAALTAIEQLLSRLDDATTVLSNHAKPDGPGCEDAIGQLYQLLDTPDFLAEVRAAEAAAASLRASLGPKAA